MGLKTILNYSPNFYSTKRNIKQIKFIIFHYTGMKKESAAIKRLTSIQSEVSSHYFIKYNGEIINLVPDLYTAWHAGSSYWKNFKSLNKNSIGIEISNPGHNFKYKKFTKMQINSLLKLSKFLIKKYKINLENILGHSDIAPNRKKDPGEKFPWKYLAKNKIGIWHKLSNNALKKNRILNIDDVSKKLFYKNLFQIGYSRNLPKNTDKNKYLNFLVKAFQRRFRQELVNGKIDKECLLISENLLNKSDKFS
ncbi:N-acetylmuramoyl-L-alanine amidase [Pelagibacterales bacterium SAG-MED20]|nr:N-acetylmuramoyl-L-alanine amidase [Pelagibacterales bacterium SAG-MED20]